MNKLESTLICIAMGAMPPLLLFFVTWWSAYGIALAMQSLMGNSLSEKAIAASALAGLAGGVLLDCFFLKRWAGNVYRLRVPFLVAAYIGCAIFGFAACMGVPVLHPLLGVLAGLYVGRRLAHSGAEPAEGRQAVRRVARFAAVVMFIICVLSAAIALVNPTTPGELQRLFHAPFNISWTMVGGLILVGGAILISVQYWLAWAAATLAYGRPRSLATRTGE
jgi:hypothetical protein